MTKTKMDLDDYNSILMRVNNLENISFLQDIIPYTNYMWIMMRK